MLHRFQQSIDAQTINDQFVDPFSCATHPLVQLAIEQFKQQMGGSLSIFSSGKMMGVMLVKDDDGELGFLTAFSGIVDGRNVIEGFVPPVYDFLQEGGFFKLGEAEVGELTRQIEDIERETGYSKQKAELLTQEKAYKQWVLQQKELLKQKKLSCAELKQQGVFEGYDRAIMEMQKMKAEHEVQKKNELAKLAERKAMLQDVETEITALKAQRTSISSRVQAQLFEHFVLLNSKGEKKTVAQIFSDYNAMLPPAGAGECAGPKLLQYAFLHNLKPLCMSEFWYGASPKSELRHDGAFYPPCERMCRPILTYMMEGLELTDEKSTNEEKQPTVLYEDAWIIVVDKPSGMLSVPGKVDQLSVYDWAKEKYKDIEEPIIVHRLDMSTSGLLILTKTKEANKAFQNLFQTRQITKQYLALLDGVLQKNNGEINLPLTMDVENRPKQKVDYERGKPSLTTFEVVGEKHGKTLVKLFPHTGRTHQLRVHCAHKEGLNIPILDDELYGNRSEEMGRLCLHAQSIRFVHPFTNEVVEIKSDPDFIC